MSITVSDSINVGQQKSVDKKLDNDGLTYANVAAVNAALTTGVRHIGLTVQIVDPLDSTKRIEYWYQGGILDTDLVLKTAGSSGSQDLQETLDNGSSATIATDFNVYTANSTFNLENGGNVGLYGTGNFNIGDFNSITTNGIPITEIIDPTVADGAANKGYTDTQDAQVLSNANDYTDAGLLTKYDNPTGNTTQYIRGDGSLATLPAGGSGTVTNVTGLNGVTVTDGTTTPQIGLGAITPSSVNASGTVAGSNLSGTNTGDNSTNTTSNTYADGKVAQTITDGVTASAPSQDVVFDALALKAKAPLSEKGIIIDETTLTSSHFVIGANWSVTGNNFNVPDGTNSFSISTNKVTENFYGRTNLSKWKAEFNYTIPTISSTSYGVAFGTSGVRPLIVRFCASTGKTGRIEVYYDEGTTVIYETSPGFLDITAGDVTNIIVRREYNNVYVEWKNGAKINTWEFTVPSDAGSSAAPPNWGRFTFWANGGVSTINGFKVNSKELVGADIAYRTDSTGSSTILNNADSWISLVSEYLNITSARFVGNGDKIEETNWAEIVAHNPKYILISCFSNNVAAGDSGATIVTKINAANISNAVSGVVG